MVECFEACSSCLHYFSVVAQALQKQREEAEREEKAKALLPELQSLVSTAETAASKAYNLTGRNFQMQFAGGFPQPGPPPPKAPPPVLGSAPLRESCSSQGLDALYHGEILRSAHVIEKAGSHSVQLLDHFNILSLHMFIWIFPQ